MVNQVTTTRPLDMPTRSGDMGRSGTDDKAFDKALGNGQGIRGSGGGTQGAVVNDGSYGHGPAVQGPQGGKDTGHCGCGPEQLDRAFGKPGNGDQGGGLPASLLGDLKQLTSDYKSGNMSAVAQDIGKLLTDLMGGGSPPATPAQGAKAPAPPADSSAAPPNGAPPSSSTATPSSATPTGGMAPAGAGKPNPASVSPAASPGGMQDLTAVLEKLLKDLKSGDKTASDSDLQQLLSMLGGAGGAGQGGPSPGGIQGTGGPSPAPDVGTPGASPAGATSGAAAGAAPAGQPTAQQPDMSAVLKAVTSLLEDLKSGNTQGVQQDIQALSDVLQKTPAPAGATT